MSENSPDNTGNVKLPVDVVSPQIGTLQDIKSKKRCLQNLAKLLMIGIDESELDYLEEDFNELDIFDALCDREQLGSTGIGNGCAIPHGRIPRLKSPKIAVLTLAEPIDFDAIDGKPVDIVVGLLAPVTDSKQSSTHDLHLQVLATVAELLDKKDNRELIRKEMAARNLQAVLEDKLTKIWDKEVNS